MFMAGATQTAAPAGAGLGRRVAARIVDGIASIVLAIIVGLALIIATFTFGSDLGIDDDTLATLGDLVLLFAIVIVLLGPLLAAMAVGVFSGLFGKGTGTTPGRRLLRLRVVDARDGEPSRGRAALHGLLRHVPTVLLFASVFPVFLDGDVIVLPALAGAVLLVVDIVTALARGDDRALHDVLAGVTVVRRPIER